MSASMRRSMVSVNASVSREGDHPLRRRRTVGIPDPAARIRHVGKAARPSIGRCSPLTTTVPLIVPSARLGMMPANAMHNVIFRLPSADDATNEPDGTSKSICLRLSTALPRPLAAYFHQVANRDHATHPYMPADTLRSDSDNRGSPIQR